MLGIVRLLSLVPGLDEDFDYKELVMSKVYYVNMVRDNGYVGLSTMPEAWSVDNVIIGNHRPDWLGKRVVVELREATEEEIIEFEKSKTDY